MDYNKFTMGLLDKFKRKIELTLAESRQDEELMYEYIADEMDLGIIRKGLFTKALANSKGDEKEANSLYLKYRLQSVKDSLKGKSSAEYFRDNILNQQNIDEDESFYLMATYEINTGDINRALWAKCLAINMGDETKAKYDYINKRVTILAKEYKRILRKITKEEYLKIFDKYNLPGKKDSEVDIESGKYFPKAPEGEIYLTEFNESIKNRLSKEI
jgi:hypothetical protein